MKTNIPLTDDPAQEEDLLRRFWERIEKLSQQDGVFKFCTDAGFLTTVEVGQYFMTKDIEEFSQFTNSGLSWAHFAKRRKFIWTIRLDSNEHQDWIRIGSYNQLPAVKYGVQIRYESVNRQFSLVGQFFSWPEQVGHEFEQQRTRNLRNSVRRMCVKIECKCFCKPIKSQNKPQRRTSVSSSTKTIPIGERTWTDVEPQECSLSDCSMSEKLINLLRHCRLPRENDGAIEFWRLKDCLRHEFENSRHWSNLCHR